MRPIELDLNGDAGTAWGNLGFWETGADYPRAAERLARRIGDLAQLASARRMLDLGFGPGEQWRLWQEDFGVDEIVGFEPDAGHCAWAEQRRRPQDRIHCAAASAVADHIIPGSVDAVVAVDAAYHFEDRCELLATLGRCLRPTGRAAWSDLVLTSGAERPGPVLRALLASAGIPAENLLSPERYGDALTGAGWRDVSLVRVDAEVLAGFADWWSTRRPRRMHPRMWLRAEFTARLLSANRRGGWLGYVLVSAAPPEETGD